MSDSSQEAEVRRRVEEIQASRAATARSLSGLVGAVCFFYIPLFIVVWGGALGLAVRLYRYITGVPQ